MQKRFIPILFSVIILSSAESISDERDQRPIAELVEAARQAKDRQDDKKFDEVITQIYRRVTGFDISILEIPEGVTHAEFDERICAYRKVISPLHTPSEIDILRHSARLLGYSLITSEEENPHYRALMSCAHDNGELIPFGKALREGKIWARRLQSASRDEAREMTQEYEDLLGKHPGNRFYKDIIQLIRKVTDKDGSANEVQRFNDDDQKFQWNLVQTAHNGDLSAQMDLAQRLEAGDRFIQGNAKAYFWYKRALQNGGGQPAQTAVGRLYPQLSKLDLGYISFWTGLNSDPY